MQIHFYRLSNYATLCAAQKAKAVRTLWLEDVAAPDLLKGQAADIVEAVLAAVGMMDGGESVQFVLTDDVGGVLDVL